jgi:hypothetical protein
MGSSAMASDASSNKATSAGNAFNPAMSAVIGGRFYHDSEEGTGYDHFEHADGFHGHHDDDHHHHHGPEAGFKLDHIELHFAAAVDHYFDAELTLAFEEDGVEIEEAFMQTRSLPGGLTLKAGRFLSGIGYQNSQHAHDWAFADQNLPYRLFLGDHGLVDTGVQLSWVPATDTYMRFGFEAFQGEQETFANYAHEHNASFEERGGPRLMTLFGKFAPDLGWDYATQFGFSIAQAGLHQEVHDHGAGEGGLEGASTLYGLDWVFKHDAGGTRGAGSWAFQAECLYRVKDLELLYHEDPNIPTGTKREFTQDGLYLQGTYGFAPRWEAGLRYEVVGLATNEKATPAGTDSYETSSRVTAAATFSPTEFSLVRAQASSNAIYDGGDREDFTQFTLQYQVMLGAHAAHKF